MPAMAFNDHSRSSRSAADSRPPAESPDAAGGRLTGAGDNMELSDDQQMLIRVRDELYEGRWDLFETDLKARLSGEPHVFEIGPPSARLKDTITTHLRLIAGLREMECGRNSDASDSIPHPRGPL